MSCCVLERIGRKVSIYFHLSTFTCKLGVRWVRYAPIFAQGLHLRAIHPSSSAFTLAHLVSHTNTDIAVWEHKEGHACRGWSVFKSS